jgi:hypothetical protein
MTEIIKGQQIASITPIIFHGFDTGCFRVYFFNKGQGMVEHRIRGAELREALVETNFVVEEPKGNRKYPYLRLNRI